MGADGERIAIELKTLNDEIVRGFGQRAEATAFGYHQVVLVTTLRKVQRIDWGSFVTWLEKVMQQVLSEVALSLTDYTRDPAVLLRGRKKIAEQIEKLSE